MEASLAPPSPGARPEKDAHLIWSRGFLRHFSSSVVGLLAVATAAYNVPSLRMFLEDAEASFRLKLLSTAHGLAWWSVVGALSSSCCLVQVVLNLAAVGCAGFNTLLGPARPVLLAACLLLNAWAWSIALPRLWLWRQCGAASSLSVAQALVPEFLWAWAQLRQRGVKAFAPKEAQGPGPSKEGSTVVQLQIDNLGCSACLTAVTSAALASHSNVTAFTVAIETGRASLTIANSKGEKRETAIKDSAEYKVDSSGNSSDVDLVVEAVLADLDSRGFPSKECAPSSQQ